MPVSMRVDYTLPGLQPTVDPRMVRAATTAGPYGPTFADRLRRLSSTFQITWRQVLKVDQPPPGPTTIGPPPKPSVMETRDAGETGLQWRRLVDRTGEMVAQLPRGDISTNSSAGKLQRMHALMSQIQQMEDEVLSHSLSATRG